MFKQIIAVLSVGCILSACEPGQEPQVTKANVGMITGAALGAWAGHNVGGGSGKVVATAAGTLLGAALGHEVGASLDRADMAYYHSTSQKALETAQPGETLPWKNPDNGHSGTVTPSNYYQRADGGYCREYSQTINVGGKAQQGYGTACRQPDGTWKIVE